MSSRILRLAILALGVATMLGGDCEGKGPDFFDLIGGGGGDQMPPVIVFRTPNNTILNDDKVCINVTDQGGSGLNLVTATSGTTTLPVTAGTGAGDFNIGIGTASEGAHVIQVNADDNAGNESTGSVNIEKDVTAPTIDTFEVPDGQTSSEASLNLTWTWRISDAHLLNTSHFELRTAGNDGVIGNTDDQAVPQGTGGGQADNPIQDVTCTNGNCSANVTIFNGAPANQTVTRMYYGMVNASDTADDCLGANNPNTTTANSPGSSISWEGSTGGGFNVTFGMPGPGYCHIALGDSRTYSGFGTDPIQVGASYSVVWTGPGTVGGTTRTGTLDAGGRGFDEQMINQFGTYTGMFSVTVGGNTETASTTVNVTSAQGACQQISSIRYKQGIAALLPEDARPLGLRPVAFRYVEPWGDPSEPRIGLIAEEVAEVFPDAVLRDNEDRPYAIDYRVLSGAVADALLARSARAIQEAVADLARDR